MPTLKSLIFMRINHKSRILFPRASHSLLRVFVSLVYEQIRYRSTICCWWQMAEAWRGFLKRVKKACMCKVALGRFRSYGLKSQNEVPKQGEEEEENSDPECGILISGPRFARGLWLLCQEKIQRLPALPKRTLRTRKEFQMSKRSTTRFLLFLFHGQEPRRAWKLRWTRSCPKTLWSRFWWHKVENRACSCCNGLKLHVCKRDVIKVVEEIDNWKYRAVSSDNCRWFFRQHRRLQTEKGLILAWRLGIGVSGFFIRKKRILFFLPL